MSINPNDEAGLSNLRLISRKRYAIPSLFISAFMLLLFSNASSVAKGPFGSIEIAGWSGGAFTDDKTGAFNGCTVSGTYKSDITMFVTVHRDLTWNLGFSRKTWRLKNGVRTPILIKFEGQDSFNVPAEALSSHTIFVPMPNNSALAEQFRSAEIMSVFIAEHQFRFRLTGTSQLLPALVRCVNTVKTGGLAAAGDFTLPTKNATTSAETGLRSSEPDADKPSLTQQLSYAYRRFDNSKQCWVFQSDNDLFCMSQKSVTTRSIKDGSIKLYVFSGDNRSDESRAARGRLGLFAEKIIKGKSSFYTINRDIPSGTWGHVADDATSVAKIGPDLWGWVIMEGGIGQGYSNYAYSIIPADTEDYSARGKPIGDFPAVYSDCDAHADGRPCRNLEFKLGFNLETKANKYYDAILTVSGKREGKPTNEKFTLKWNETAQMYGPIRFPFPEDYKLDKYIAALEKLQNGSIQKDTTPTSVSAPTPSSSTQLIDENIDFSAPAGSAQITLTSQSEDEARILVDGTLAYGDEVRFRKLAMRLAAKRIIISFNSPGGNLNAGIEIGQTIHLMGYDTSVGNDQVCASACALAWLGGSKRVIANDGRVGFHAAYVEKDGSLIENGLANALIGAYVNKLGLPTKALFFVASVPPDKVHWLTPKMAADAGINVSLPN